jgi:ribose/xylose/arabinose/galactoside ABC-type transport system permease subunit
VKKTRTLRNVVSQYGVLLVILILAIIFANIIYPGATNFNNLASMSTFGVEIGLIAFGEAIVILGGGGGIDLSVGSIFALSQIIVAVLIGHGLNMWLAIAISLIAGVIMGAINGVLVTRLRIPAIIATLATMYGFSGVALVISNGTDISNFPATYAIFGQGLLGGIPFQLLFIYLPIAILLWYLITRTIYGYKLYLTGTNELAARLSGINVGTVRTWAYVITGLLCAIASIVSSSRLATAQPDAGGTVNLAAITIAVLGGTSIFGGRGSIAGTFLATVVITIIEYSFDLANINSVVETGVIGIILVLVLLLQNYLGKWMSRARQSTKQVVAGNS